MTVPPQAPQPGWSGQPPTEPYAWPPPTAPYAGPPHAGPYAAPPVAGQWAGQWPPQVGPPAFGPRPDLASWGQRVGALLIDMLFELPGLVLYVVGISLAVANAPTTSRTGRVLTPGNAGLMWLGVALLGGGILGLLVISIYNRVVLQGRTGQTWGKRRLGLRVQHQDTGQLIGIGNTFLRQLCHALDGFAYVGYLWPLWDTMRQTFADKIMRTVVVTVR